MQASAVLASAKIHPSNITIKERKAITALNKDNSSTILLEDKGRCTVIFNQSDYHSEITTLLSDKNTYKTLKVPTTTVFLLSKGNNYEKVLNSNSG